MELVKQAVMLSLLSHSLLSKILKIKVLKTIMFKYCSILV